MKFLAKENSFSRTEEVIRENSEGEMFFRKFTKKSENLPSLSKNKLNSMSFRVDSETRGDWWTLFIMVW